MTTVLVVDDTVVDQKLATAWLEEAGCHVLVAEDGKAALAHIKEDAPDVVLTDLQMPEMDGLELVKTMRRDHPQVPVILMTAFGNEQIAVEALRAGAVSYVPKKNLGQELKEALRAVMSALEVSQQRDQVRDFLKESTSQFVLGYQPGGTQALISYLLDGLTRLNFCGQSTLFQLTTALTEAINNAVDHGNLELDSKIREEEDDAAYRRLGAERAKQAPYCDRQVHVTATFTAEEAKFVIRDEGSGFDRSELPDPTDPENLLKSSGRGVMLMQTFMDEVIFNDRGNEVTLIKRRAS